MPHLVASEWVVVFSPEGAAQLSPGRKPWVSALIKNSAPKGRHTDCVAPSGLFCFGRRGHPGLTPWARLCRHFGAKDVTLFWPAVSSSATTERPPRRTTP